MCIPSKKQLLTSGTLGDAFIVLCRLYGRHKITGEHFQIIRFSSHPEMDGVIEAMYRTVSFIEYITPCRVTLGYNELKRNLNALPYDHINSTWNGKEDIGLKRDPEGYPMECYPELDIPKVEINDPKFKVGIQLQTGKERGNFKGFDLSWISSIRKTLEDKDHSMYLFGTGAGYSIEKVRRFCRENDIVDMVGKTAVPMWLAYIKKMDYFITPEGFSAFFAMSQKVRSLVFYTDYQILGRVPPEWRRANVIMSAAQEAFPQRAKNYFTRKIYGRNSLFAPIKPRQVWSLIYGEKAYL